MTRVLLLSLALVCFAYHGHAEAQNRDLVAVNSPSETAHALFIESREQIEAGQFAEAVESLERSMRLQPNVASAFALVVALRGMGDFRLALERLEALRGGAFGFIPPEREEQLDRLHQRLDASLASLDIRICGAANPRVWIDGHAVEISEECGLQRIRLNPGEHNLSAVAEQSHPIRRLFSLVPGEERRLDLTLRRQTSRPSAATPWYRSPWVWITVGVLAAGAGAGLAVGLSSGRDGTGALPGEVVQALH